MLHSNLSCKPEKSSNGLTTYKCNVPQVQGRHHDSSSSSSSDSRSDGLFLRCYGKNKYHGNDPSILLHCTLYDQHGDEAGELHVTLINNMTSIQHEVKLKCGSGFRLARLLGNDLTLTITPIDNTIAKAFPTAAQYQGMPGYGIFLGLDSHTVKQDDIITRWEHHGPNEVFKHTKYVEARCPYLVDGTGRIVSGLGCHFWFSTQLPKHI